MADIDAVLGEVLALNREWARSNTPAMERRGLLVRRDIPLWIAERRATLVAAMGVDDTDFGVEGSDGTGLKSEVPWARLFAKSRSRRATEGWYLVYLFSADGETVYLSLNQGTTEWTGASYVPRPVNELAQRVTWARDMLRASPSFRAELVEDIDLGARRTRLGRAYEDGNVVALAYPARRIPGEGELHQDLVYMTGLLGETYRRYDAAPWVPGDLEPEVYEAVTAAERASGLIGDRHRGQGFGLTAAQREAVEKHAVRMVMKYLRDRGWAPEDVGAKKTWDIEARRGTELLFAEVKGTTSPGGSVIMTGSEVRAYREREPHTALFVVHRIALDRSAALPVASGGLIHEVWPWTIDDADLETVSVRYTTGL